HSYPAPVRSVLSSDQWQSTPAGPWTGSGDRQRTGGGSRWARGGGESSRDWRAVHVHLACSRGARDGAAASRERERVTHPNVAPVLVVDDEPAILRAVQMNLGRHDFRVEIAANAQEAFEAMARVHPDLILLDLGLPDMDGLEVLQTIRKRANTPVVVL